MAIAAKPRVPASPRKLPVLAIDATGLGYAVGTPPVPVSPSLTVQPSGITLTGATVRISSGLADTDSLGFTSQHGITGRYNAKTGVLTLTGKASQVSYQEALRSVTYRNVKSAVAVARRTISFQVTGGTPAGSLSNVVSRVITVSDQPPTAANDTATTDKNTAISIDVLAKDSDPAGRPLHIASVNTTGTKGKVSVNPDGTISYNPNGQFASLPKGQTATDSFTYRVSDGARTSNSESRSATVTVTITGGNDSPLISNVETAPLNYQAFSPATAVTGALTLSDDDDTVISGATVTISSGLHAGADTLSFTNQNGIQGSYNAGTGVLTLTGASSLADYQAALRSVDFAAKDPAASPATRTVSFTVTDSAGATSAPVSRNISVTPVAPPTAADDTASTGKNAPVDINVLANDSDPAGLPLTVAAVGTKGTLGQVSVNSDGTIHYDPAGQFASLQQGQTATDTFTYTATDGSQTSSPATVTVTITGSNDAPVISGVETTGLSYQAAAPAAAVASTLTVSDDDTATMAGASVAITSGLDAGADTLSFTNQNGISGSYDATSGVLTLTGPASTADYQAALRSVRFSTSDSSASPAARTVSFTVTDSLGKTSSAVARTVAVTEIAPPTAADDTVSTGKNAAIDIHVLANDSDPAGLPLTVAAVGTKGTLGQVSVNSDGTIHYDPNGQFTDLTAGQTATDTFTYTATDGSQTSSPATVTVTITGSNDAPVISGLEATPFSYQSGTPPVAVTSTLTVSDDDDTTMAGATVAITSGFDAAADTLSFTNQNGISGSYDATSGVLTLTGTASTAHYQAALRSVQFSTSDDSASPAARTVSFTVTDSLGKTSSAVARTVAVTEIAPPTAADDTVSTDKNAAVDIHVLANDSDSAGLPLTVAAVDTTGTIGSVSVNSDGTIHYDPNGQFTDLTAGQTATDTFTYTATDGTQTSNAATVTVTITGSDDAPVLSDVETTPLSYQAGTPAAAVTSTLTVSDDDTTTMSGASVAIGSGFDAGADTLSFTNQNGISGSYDATSGVLTLTGKATTANYVTALQSVQFSTSDDSASPAARTVSFTVTDSLGATSAAVTRTVAVTEIAPPTAADDTASTGKNAAIDINVLANDSDPAGLLLTVASVDTTGTVGQVSVNSDGSIHYDPNGQFASLQQGQTATDTFTYTATDGTQTSNPALVTVTITGSDDAPVLSNVETTPLSYQAGTPAAAVTSTLTVSDDDDTMMSGATVSVTSGFDASVDTLSFTNQNGISGSYDATSGVLTLTGTATTADYEAALRSVQFTTMDPAASPAARTVSFTVTDLLGATSSAAARTVAVTAIAPPVAADDTASTGKNAAVDINVLANDSDPAGLPLTVASIGTTGTIGSVSVNGDGTIHYDPAGQFASLQQGQTATDTFTYTATDGSQTSSPATVTITITGSDDLPVISGVGTTPVTYTAQSPAVPVSPGLSLSDDDDDTIVAAIAVIANGGDVSGDVLAFDSENGITGSYDASDQDLLMTGAASLADYQAALRSVTFATSDGSASPAARNVGFAVEDSLGQVSETEIQSVTVTAAAVPPDAVTQSYTTPDLAVRLSVTRRTDRGYGTLTANTDSTFT